MKIFRNLTELPVFKKAVITIGTFDGVHLGHAKLLTRIKDLAKRIKGESILITFHPHPRSIIGDGRKIALLSLLEEKFVLLEKLGIDHVVVVPFSRDFSQQSPQTYITDFLVKNFNPSVIVIGYDHKFGKDRAGDIHLLHQMSKVYGFQVEEVSKQQVEDMGISSTKIRRALQEGSVETAQTLLGYPYAMKGLVVKGRQLGRTIGFPTANLVVENQAKLIPSNGVYAVKVQVREKKYQGMLNIGVRPTVDDTLQKTVEVNIFGFDKDIYGEAITIEFLHFIRSEQKFAGVEELKQQLAKDKIKTLNLLADEREDKRNYLKDKTPFSYRVSKEKVMVYHEQKLVRTYKASKINVTLQKLEQAATEYDRQLILAKLTGHFKH